MRRCARFVAVVGMVASLTSGAASAGASASRALVRLDAAKGPVAVGAAALGSLTGRTWGDNTAGELGDDSLTQRDAPVAVHGLKGAMAVAAGGRHDLALLRNGTVVTWGDNTFGELCTGTASSNGDSEHPAHVAGLRKVSAVAAGESHSLFLRVDGTVMACGDNRDGQLGDGSARSSAVPARVAGLTGVTAVAAGDEFSLALLKDGTVRSFGTNQNGELGDALQQQNSDVPVQVKGLTGVKAIAAGGIAAVALLRNGTVMVWGDNAIVPVAVRGLTGVRAVAAGPGSFLALLANGTVMTWQGDSATFTTPTPVPGVAHATAIAAGGLFQMAIVAGGKVKAWGDGTFGELGDGSTISSQAPVTVKGLAGATAIAAAGEQAIALAPGSPPPASIRTGPFSTIWRQTANPQNVAEPGGLADTFLESVSAASATDAWAVGFHSLASSQPLAEHFNGRNWKIAHIPLPPGAPGGEFTGVDELSPANVWAVGDSSGSTGQTLAEHFTGSAWTIVPTPNKFTSAGSTNQFSAVAGTGPDDVWAVGRAFDLQTQAVGLLFEHFNGTSWRMAAQPSAGLGGFPVLEAVAAVSRKDVWAVGETSAGLTDKTLTAHWNGHSWRVVPSPCLRASGAVAATCKDTEQNCLTGVTALGPRNVWASGYETSGDNRIPYVLHWNGTKWSLAKTPNIGLPVGTTLSGITALSATDIWVAGSSFGLPGNLGFSVIEHFNGRSWSVVASLHPGETGDVPDDTLAAITDVEPHTLFTVGALHLPDPGFCCEFGFAERATTG